MKPEHARAIERGYPDRSGNSYAGTFTIDQFDVDGNVLAHIAGQVTATRITAE
jgi:hypothetical protein